MKKKMENIRIASVNFSSTFLLLILFEAFQITSQISNGLEASSGQFPYQVAIIEVHRFVCGGGIIDATHVLTAGHCVTDKSECMLSITAGVIHWYAFNGMVRYVKKIHVHPDFATKFTDSRTGQERPLSTPVNDIAVLTLDGPLEGPNIGSMSFPRAKVEATNYDCALCSFAGWGQIGLTQPKSNRLLYMTMKVLTVRECVKREGFPQVNEFCAVDFFKKETAFNGGSGGPLVCDGEVVGIAVSGRRVLGAPVRYTSVYAYITWIKDILEN